MVDMLDDSWASWQRQVQSHFDEHGLLPTPTTAGFEIPFDLATECWTATDDSPEDLPALCRATNAMGTAVERAAVLLFLSYLKDDEPYLRLPEADESRRRAAVRKLYSEAVSLLPTDQIDAAWQIRWELPFAATAALWDRTDGLVQQWLAIAPSEDDDALTALARINFLSVHPARPGDWVFDWWSPYEGSKYSRFGDLLASLLGLRLDDRPKLDSAPWSLPRTMSADQFARVLDAENALAKLTDTGRGRAELRLVSAWCNAVAAVRYGNTDRMRDAARRYALLAKEPDPLKALFDDETDTLRRLPAWSAAMLFRAAGDLDSAQEMAVLWTTVDRDSPDGWKFRAELERQIGLDEWTASYERYLQLSPETDTSWEHSELLRLLLESRDLTTADRALRALALEHADKPVVEQMLTWDWPTFPQLHESTRERWWDGLVFVCDGRVRNAFRRAPWRYAAWCFAGAVELELRVRVFGPLAGSEELNQLASSNRDWRISNAILNSRATLGTMIEALELAGNTKSDLGQRIDRFLSQKHRPLRQHFRARPAVARIRAAIESRNEAAHGLGDITAEEAKQVYADARAFLDMLVKEDPRVAKP